MSHHQQAAVSAVPVLSSAHRLTLHSLFPGGRGLRVYLNTMLWAQTLSPDYDVWLEWDYSRLSNDGFFTAPADQDGFLTCEGEARNLVFHIQQKAQPGHTPPGLEPP